MVTVLLAVFKKARTKDEAVQALVTHVLVDEYPVREVDAAAEQAYEVAVLQLGDQVHLVLELFHALHSVLR